MISEGKITILVLVSISVVFTVISLATNFWMEGCFDVTGYMRVLRNLTAKVFDEAEAVKRFDPPLRFFKSPITCFSSGLFRYEIESSSFSATLQHGKESKLLHAIAGLLIVSLLAEAAGAILCCIGSHLDPHGSVGRSKFLAGTIIIAFAGLCLLTGMIVFTAIMTPATGNKPMVFFDLLQHGITSVGKSRRSAPPNHPKLTAIEKEAVARFQYSFYLGWMSCLLLICVSVFNSVIALRKKRDTTSQIALK